MNDRNATLDQLTAAPFDVLVVGGGIVGAGVARDAAIRGLRTGLVEQHDFAFGTSSRSSRLLHGGLRYLAQGRLRLVYEASREKCLLSQIAPHLADPLAFVFPTYRRSAWPRWQLAVGVKLYDALCGGRNLGRSNVLSSSQIEETLPGVKAEGLTGGVRYFDALTNDARLVIDTLRSAARAGALLGNYVRLEGAHRAANGWRCNVFDAQGGRSLELHARVVVNATGPWAEGLGPSGVRLRLTKGVHLVVDRQRLPVPDAVVMTDGPRILFAIPWGERVILGTTDTDYTGSLDVVEADGDDIAYVLAVVNRSFPAAGLTATDVRSTWAGLRPLIASKRGGPSDISRAHLIAMPQPGWIDVAGGKLTTYRRIAEQTIDRAVDHLAIQRRPCRTADEPLLPAAETRDTSGVVPPALSRTLVEHFCHHEWAEHLDDVMLRRSSWTHYLDQPHEAARQVAQWMAELLAWSTPRHAAELGRMRLE
jgi:glycerol-3-phosphate dehydrogenase